MAERAMQSQPMTFEEAAMLDPDEFPGEIVDGVWIPMAKGTWRHGKIVVNVTFALKNYTRGHPGWSIAAGDPGTRLRRSPDLLRGPDLGLSRAERRPTGKGAEGWLLGAPDLAVEVVGDAQTASQLARKGLEYLGAGGTLVWILDPDSVTIMVLTAPNQLRILGPEDTLDGGDLLPGFSCSVAELFE